MGKLSLKDKVCILISWALMLMYSAAEREYFPQTRNFTWNDARNHCQVCYKDLVTLTPENIQNMAQKLTSDYWVGLRKNFTSNFSMSWSRWANGDPLAFQNWYPGWPVFKSSFPKRYCCSCSCTCPAVTTPRMSSSTRFTDFATQNLANVSSFTDVTDQNVTPVTQNMTSSSEWRHNSTQNTPVFTTAAPIAEVEAACVRSPLLPPDVPETDQNYIEDSCVAMLSFGAWVEKNCLELLPFICYDDRFFGQANVTQVTSMSANLTWLPGPVNTGHYRVVVNKEPTKNVTNLTYDLVNLIAGTQYYVQVFPVKCTRDLNPQEVAFYTTPNKVENLTVTNVTETSISLSWCKPAGNVDFYLIEVQGRKTESNTESTEVVDLIPGNLYTITVLSGVEDKSTWSEESNITRYTKPGKVSDLRVSENTNDSLLLNWEPPEGNTTGYCVKAMNDNNDVFNKVVNQTEVRVTGLPVGSKITLSVTALANDTLEGDKVTVVNYTAPGPITNLFLVPTHNSLTATWNSVGNYSSFTVQLLLDGNDVKTRHNLTEPKERFGSLKTAANYTVIVYSVSGHLTGQPVESSKFTLPSAPTDAKVIHCDKKQITFAWKAPVDIATARYVVNLRSSFWGHSWSGTVVNNTNYTFDNLKSGTRYEFEVRTVADGVLSPPANKSHYTVAEKREIGLSMLCSSTVSLLCDNSTTRKNAFDQLKTHFNDLFGDNIFWNLEEQETEN